MQCNVSIGNSKVRCSMAMYRVFDAVSSESHRIFSSSIFRRLFEIESGWEAMRLLLDKEPFYSKRCESFAICKNAIVYYVAWATFSMLLLKSQSCFISLPLDCTFCQRFVRQSWFAHLHRHTTHAHHPKGAGGRPRQEWLDQNAIWFHNTFSQTRQQTARYLWKRDTLNYN